jgi:NADPH-dependent glutamate synthase beta subunit-like oxidoreductase/Pyruvate/2-oxoacid:ferredoxin oxidoreductase delta subunit
MGLLKEKKKKKLGGRTMPGQAAGSGETSNLRPKYVEKTPPCMVGCPGGTRIRDVLTTIAQTEKKGRTWDESYTQAWHIITEKNPLPAVCGRVCPHPCEAECNRGKKEGPVAINNVERFIGDYGIKKGLKPKLVSEDRREERIAVIGAGPAGLSAAYHLAIRGYRVTVFEAFSKGGGMLRYGIPAYRLPRNVLDAEIQRIAELGVEFKYDTVIGKDVPYESLEKDFHAVFVGIGAHKGRELGVDGEDAENVFTGVGFLNMVNSGKPVDIGDKVAVIGGGDTAIDAARISRRLGAKEVTILYRRTRTEMPAIDEEIDGALEEGVKIEYLVAPAEVVRDGARAVGLKCIRMELGEPDESGRRRPVPVAGSEFLVETTCIIPAISQEPEFDGFDTFHEGRDWIKTDDEFKTPVEKAYAGGDALKLGLVTIAIAQGRQAAEAIDRHVRGVNRPPSGQMPVIRWDKMLLDFYEPAERHEEEHLPVAERFGALDIEIAKTLTEDEIKAEVKRCMSCGMCMECENCWKYCQDNAVIRPTEPGESFQFKLEFCQGCKKCAENCPCGYIDML